jgi:hypothetical protein
MVGNDRTTRQLAGLYDAHFMRNGRFSFTHVLTELAPAKVEGLKPEIVIIDGEVHREGLLVPTIRAISPASRIILMTGALGQEADPATYGVDYAFPPLEYVEMKGRLLDILEPVPAD